jgi:hypothetical protein
MYMDLVYYFRSKWRQITLEVIMKKSLNGEFKYFVIYVISTCLSSRMFSDFIPLFLGILLVLVYSPLQVLWQVDLIIWLKYL